MTHVRNVWRRGDRSSSLNRMHRTAHPDLLLSYRGFHARKDMLERRGRDPKVTAKWVAERDDQDQDKRARSRQHSQHPEVHPQARRAQELDPKNPDIQRFLDAVVTYKRSIARQ